MQIDYNIDDILAVRGNLNRVWSVLNRAGQGEAVTLGFLGGSITEGTGASNQTLCYAYRVYNWWKRSFPQSQVTYINAGIGATTSQFGVARVDEDILRHQPDLVVIDFTVNDEMPERRETFEGLLRHILHSDCNPAILVLNNMYYTDGKCAQEDHNEIASHYGVPSVSVKNTVYRSIVKGEVDIKQVTDDGLHPNDGGHEQVAHLITQVCEYTMSSAYDKSGDSTTWPELPDPLTDNAYEQSIRCDNRNTMARGNGFAPDTSVRLNVADRFKGGFIGHRKGDYIDMYIPGGNIAVQYKKSLKKPACIAKLTIDGEYETILDANFDEDWGDKLEITTVMSHETYDVRCVRVEIIEGDESCEPFYLASIIAS